MNSEILTAEEFVKKFRKTNPIANAESIEHWMAQHCIEFSKLHVEAALKEASESDIDNGRSYRHRSESDKNE